MNRLIQPFRVRRELASAVADVGVLSTKHRSKEARMLAQALRLRTDSIQLSDPFKE